MNIPDKIIDSIELLPAADRGQVYCAIIGFMRDGSLPSFEMSDTARGAFEMARLILTPILRRREREKAYRLRKKMAAVKTPPIEIVQPERSDIKDADIPLTDSTPHTARCPTRQQRRSLERAARKKSLQQKAARA